MNDLGVFGRYTKTMQTIARVYDIGNAYVRRSAERMRRIEEPPERWDRVMDAWLR